MSQLFTTQSDSGACVFVFFFFSFSKVSVCICYYQWMASYDGLLPFWQPFDQFIVMQILMLPCYRKQTLSLTRCSDAGPNTTQPTMYRSYFHLTQTTAVDDSWKTALHRECYYHTSLECDKENMCSSYRLQVKLGTHYPCPQTVFARSGHGP